MEEGTGPGIQERSKPIGPSTTTLRELANALAFSTIGFAAAEADPTESRHGGERPDVVFQVQARTERLAVLAVEVAACACDKRESFSCTLLFRKNARHSFGTCERTVAERLRVIMRAGNSRPSSADRHHA